MSKLTTLNKLKGIFIQGNFENTSQRVYPMDELREAINKLNHYPKHCYE